MYLYTGGESAIEKRDIIGIFDIDKISQSHITRAYLSLAEKGGHLINEAEDIPKTFLVLADETVILAQPNTAILAKRINEK